MAGFVNFSLLLSIFLLYSSLSRPMLSVRNDFMKTQLSHLSRQDHFLSIAGRSCFLLVTTLSFSHFHQSIHFILFCHESSFSKPSWRIQVMRPRLALKVALFLTLLSLVLGHSVKVPRCSHVLMSSTSMRLMSHLWCFTLEKERHVSITSFAL
jgi:hypothetical protein